MEFLFLMALIVISVYVRILKKDIKAIKRDLDFINKEDTNLNLVSKSGDRDIVSLIKSINDTIESRKEIKKEARVSSLETRETISNISHDIKTPLTSIIGYTALLRSKNLKEDKRIEYVKILEGRLEYLKNLIDSFFEYSKVVEKNCDIKLEKIRLDVVIEDIMASYYDEFLNKGFDIKIEMSSKAIYVLADEKVLNRIIRNLVQNALVHGKESFKIEIRDSKMILKNKTDNIENLDTSKVFDRFFRGDKARTKKGTGLGLTIVSELTKSINCSIKAYKDNLFYVIELDFKMSDL